LLGSGANSTKTKRRFLMGFNPVVDKNKCVGVDDCGECVEVCPVEVFEGGEDGKSDPVNADECLGCESCIEVCPNEAITVEEIDN
jgi:NAD-dependent dihydropyrimidine dehydrogenase PreA subunit